MNILFGLFVIGCAVYFKIKFKPKSIDAKIIFGLLVTSGCVLLVGTLDISSAYTLILSILSVGMPVIMLAAYYGQCVSEKNAAAARHTRHNKTSQIETKKKLTEKAA